MTRIARIAMIRAGHRRWLRAFEIESESDDEQELDDLALRHRALRDPMDFPQLELLDVCEPTVRERGIAGAW